MVDTFPEIVLEVDQCVLHNPLYEITTGIMLLAHVAGVPVVSVGVIHIE